MVISPITGFVPQGQEIVSAFKEWLKERKLSTWSCTFKTCSIKRECLSTDQEIHSGIATIEVDTKFINKLKIINLSLSNISFLNFTIFLQFAIQLKNNDEKLPNVLKLKSTESSLFQKRKDIAKHILKIGGKFTNYTI